MPGDADWSDARLDVTYREVRQVLDAQQRTLSDIDDKAMRTVRITAILAGVLISTFQFSPGILDPRFTGIGGVFLLASIGFGVEAYYESDNFIGPTNEYVVQLVENDFEERSWEEDLLLTYGGFIQQNEDEIRVNARLFRAQQLSFVLSIISIGVAVII